MLHPLTLAGEGAALNVNLNNFETKSLWVILGISLLALGFAIYLVRQVLSASQGTEKMQEISGAVQEGARAYLSRQFKTLFVFVIILTAGLFLLPTGAVHHSETLIKVSR